jgi:ABC-type glycerol-3-phosphate transport system permease component
VVKALKLALLILIAAALLMPLYLMVVHSLTPAKLFLKFPPELYPKEITFKNYQRIGELKYLWIWIWNLVWIAVVTVVASVIINCAAGYVFAYAKFKGEAVLFWLMMSPLFVTRFVLLVSQFVVFGKLGLRGFPSVILALLFWPMGIFLSKNYFSAMPASMAESARMDGASEWTILLRIILPISKPLIGCAVVFMGMAVMGDFCWQMLNLISQEQKTLLVGLLQSTYYAGMMNDVGYTLAVGTVLLIPYLIVFGTSSKYFIEGLKIGVEAEK